MSQPFLHISTILNIILTMSITQNSTYMWAFTNLRPSDAYHTRTHFLSVSFVRRKFWLGVPRSQIACARLNRQIRPDKDLRLGHATGRIGLQLSHVGVYTVWSSCDAINDCLGGNFILWSLWTSGYDAVLWSQELIVQRQNQFRQQICSFYCTLCSFCWDRGLKSCISIAI